MLGVGTSGRWRAGHRGTETATPSRAHTCTGFPALFCFGTCDRVCANLMSQSNKSPERVSPAPGTAGFGCNEHVGRVLRNGPRPGPQLRLAPSALCLLPLSAALLK